MARQLNYTDIQSEADILPLLLQARDMGKRSKDTVFAACFSFYVAQHPEIPEFVRKIYFADFVREEFDDGTLAAPAPEIAFSGLVTPTPEVRSALSRHEKAKSRFFSSYSQLFGNVKEKRN